MGQVSDSCLAIKSTSRLVLTLVKGVQVGGQAVLGRQSLVSTPWLTERHGYDRLPRRLQKTVNLLLTFSFSLRLDSYGASQRFLPCN